MLSSTELRRALAGGDPAMLTRVPGIGRKGAERMIIELGDRVTPTGSAPPTGRTTVVTPAAADGTDRGGAQVVEALVGLGFAARHAEHAATAAAAEPTDGAAGARDAQDTGHTTLDPAHTQRAALHHLGSRR